MDGVYVMPLGEFNDFRVHLEVAGDDEGADAEFDGALLDIAAIADNDQRLAGRDLLTLGNAPERLDVHGAEADEQLLDLAMIGLEKGDRVEPG